MRLIDFCKDVNRRELLDAKINIPKSDSLTVRKFHCKVITPRNAEKDEP